jgi:hypothetical protein
LECAEVHRQQQPRHVSSLFYHVTHQIQLHSAEHLPALLVRFGGRRGKQDAVSSTRAKFVHPEGDQLTLLGVMQAYLQVERRRRAEWASENFINIR